MYVCVRERVFVCESVCVCVRECVFVCERECVIVRVCVCERERMFESVCERVYVR